MNWLTQWITIAMKWIINIAPLLMASIHMNSCTVWHYMNVFNNTVETRLRGTGYFSRRALLVWRSQPP